MKKLKLLTSLSALVLVLSLGACSEPTDDTSSEQDEPTSSETTPEEPEPVVLSNYTLSITLKDTDGNPVVIPFYDTVYLCGDWDNWAAFIALTDAGDESSSVLTTTLEAISEGSHEFKGLIGNQDDQVDWNHLTELIVAEDGKSNATFEVAASEGDNATKNLEFTVDATKIPVLEETPMTEEEIMGLMLSAAEADYDEPWEALHGQSVEDGAVSVEVWFTTDEDEALYGKSIAYDEEDGDTTKFIVSGTAYVVDGDGEYDTQNYSNDYDDEFDNYATALSEFAYASVEDLGENATLTHEEGSSYYTLTWADNYTEVLVCQRAGDEFSVTRVEEYDPSGDVYSAEKISAAAVEALMADFSTVDWGIASDPADLIDLACITGNYSVQLIISDYVSTATISVDDYYAGSYDLSALQSTLGLDTQYIINAYYTEDALLMEMGYLICDYSLIVESMLLVNTLYTGFIPAFEEYVSFDGETWYDIGLYSGSWSDYYWSLFDNPTSLGFDKTDFALIQSGTDSDGDAVDVYTFTSYTAMYYFGLLIGADLWDDTYANPGYLAYYDYLYFYPELQELYAYYYSYGFTYVDQDQTNLALFEEYFASAFYDVGETDISELISYVEENATEYEE